MRKQITIGLTTALLVFPGAVLAHNIGNDSSVGVGLDANASARAGLGVADQNTDLPSQAGNVDVKVQQVKGERGYNDADKDGPSGNPDMGRQYDKATPKLIEAAAKGSAKARATTTGSNATTSKERKNYGWGFLFKWFGSHDEGPVGFNASSTPGLNAPAASRFESFIGKLTSVFGINFNVKTKATTTAEVK